MRGGAEDELLAAGLQGVRGGGLGAGGGELLRERGHLGAGGGELLRERRLALVRTRLRVRLVGDVSGRDRSRVGVRLDGGGLLRLGAEADALGLGAGEGLLRALERGAEGVELGGCGVARGRLACAGALDCGGGGGELRGEAQGVAAGRGAGGGAAELLELGVAGALRRGLGHARPDGALLRALQDSDCVFGLQVR